MLTAKYCHVGEDLRELDEICREVTKRQIVVQYEADDRWDEDGRVDVDDGKRENGNVVENVVNDAEEYDFGRQIFE